MCQPPPISSSASSPPATSTMQTPTDTDTPDPEPFPWDAGVFDSHCHPTDTMSTIPLIPSMQASALTIMATRSQDQQLVSQVASTSPVVNSIATFKDAVAKENVVIPSFGWHPWFSHQLYDDITTGNEEEKEGATKAITEDFKSTHYTTVLQPTSTIAQDTAFISALPDPVPLSTLIASTRARLLEYPASMIGEIGLDKAFRLPNILSSSKDKDTELLTPGTRASRLLSPYRVTISHQLAILKAQLKLAAEMRRPVSLHGVQAHGVLHDALAATWKGWEREVVSKRMMKRVAVRAEEWSSSSSDDEGYDPEFSGDDDQKTTTTPDIIPATTKHKKKKVEKEKDKEEKKALPYPPRICLHSFSGPPQIASQYLSPTIPATIFFGFSACINLANEDQKQKTRAVLEVIPDGMILLESDLHCAGGGMDGALEEVYRFVCGVQGWGLREGVERVGANYGRFVFGE